MYKCVVFCQIKYLSHIWRETAPLLWRFTGINMQNGGTEMVNVTQAVGNRRCELRMTSKDEVLWYCHDFICQKVRKILQVKRYVVYFTRPSTVYDLEFFSLPAVICVPVSRMQKKKKVLKDTIAVFLDELFPLFHYTETCSITTYLKSLKVATVWIIVIVSESL